MFMGDSRFLPIFLRIDAKDSFCQCSWDELKTSGLNTYSFYYSLQLHENELNKQKMEVNVIIFFDFLSLLLALSSEESFHILHSTNYVTHNDF